MKLLFTVLLFSALLGCRMRQQTGAVKDTDDNSTTTESSDDMSYIEANGYSLSGAEFWPFVGTAEFKYPEDVEWGFEAGSAAAQACAKKAFVRLKSFFDENWVEMQKVVGLGATNNFYLWTNDYTTDQLNRPRRKNRIWHWNSGDKDYTVGFWKWESTVTQTGECLIPEDAQIKTELQKVIDLMTAANANSPVTP